MSRPPLRILLIEDNPGDARLIREMLSESKAACEVSWVSRLSAGVEALAAGDIDVVLLDLSLPDSQGLETCRAVRNGAAENVVVIVFTGFDDVEMGTKAVQEGAQDYLVKGKVDAQLLMRSMRYAIERQQMVEQLRALSVTDEMTGLCNRRGLSMSGAQIVSLARRLKQEVYLLFADVDGMKWINDTLGHTEGDRALRDMAQLLKSTFRHSDVLARIGGDEFVVLGSCKTPEGAMTARDRLMLALREHNQRPDASYQLSISTGVVSCGPAQDFSLDDLLARADSAMYTEKQQHRALGLGRGAPPATAASFRTCAGTTP